MDGWMWMVYDVEFDCSSTCGAEEVWWLVLKGFVGILVCFFFSGVAATPSAMASNMFKNALASFKNNGFLAALREAKSNGYL